MSKYFLSYCNLISSADQLNYCKQANSLEDFLARIKQLWNCNELGNQELLREIALLNQTPIETLAASLVGIWLPYRYQPKRQLINWLIPFGHATEPFQDEYIVRCRQQLINQIIQPCTSSKFALRQAENLVDVKPAGFIFHLSRCGSTLISGCLSEPDSTCVFSESPLLTELLLDNKLSTVQQKKFLCSFINLQAAAFQNRPQLIIKWNAWDIFRFEIIRELYPQVTVIFLVRDPIEILASHQRSAGRHMAGDRSLANLHPAFNKVSTKQTLLDWQTEMLGTLLGEMNRIRRHDVILRFDYKYIDLAGMNEICRYFNLGTHKERFTERLTFHSKTPQVVFANDIQQKQTQFSDVNKAFIQTELSPLYKQFFEPQTLK
jgi:hypothetical protein